MEATGAAGVNLSAWNRDVALYSAQPAEVGPAKTLLDVLDGITMQLVDAATMTEAIDLDTWVRDMGNEAAQLLDISPPCC